MNLKQELSWFTKKLRESGDPDRARNEKRYLKSPQKFYGLTVPSLRKLAKAWLRDHKDASIEEVIKLSQALWAGEYHEQRMLAIFLLVYRVKELNFVHLPVVEHMVQTAVGWAQLDMIAAWLCGQIFKESPRRMTAVLKKWIKDGNFWVRRAALLTLLGPVRKEPRHFVLFQDLATPLLREKEFFIRKAIGWVLRELSKVDPQLVYEYVREHKGEMSGLTYREATRQLPPDLQSKLTTS